MQGDDRVWAHLHCWQVKIDKIRYNEAPDSEPADADPPEQLCRMLRMLSLLVQPSSGTVEFMGMRFTMRPLQFLAETLPGLGELTFSIELDEPLTDELLGAVLGVGTRVERLTCPSVALQSDQHANTPWPWEFLTCTTLDVGQVCRLPDPAGAKSIIGCIIQVEELVIGPEPDEVSLLLASCMGTVCHVGMNSVPCMYLPHNQLCMQRSAASALAVRDMHTHTHTHLHIHPNTYEQTPAHCATCVQAKVRGFFQQMHSERHALQLGRRRC